jgi:hypothetical protein
MATRTRAGPAQRHTRTAAWLPRRGAETGRRSVVGRWVDRCGGSGRRMMRARAALQHRVCACVCVMIAHSTRCSRTLGSAARASWRGVHSGMRARMRLHAAERCARAACSAARQRLAPCARACVLFCACACASPPLLPPLYSSAAAQQQQHLRRGGEARARQRGVRRLTHCRLPAMNAMAAASLALRGA